MAGTKREDQLRNQSRAMRKILEAIRYQHDLEMSRIYKMTRDKFIYNMF